MAQSNKRMKLTRLSAAPGWLREHPAEGAASCPRRLGTAGTASQLIRSVRPTRGLSSADGGRCLRQVAVFLALLAPACVGGASSDMPAPVAPSVDGALLRGSRAPRADALRLAVVGYWLEQIGPGRGSENEDVCVTFDRQPTADELRPPETPRFAPGLVEPAEELLPQLRPVGRHVMPERRCWEHSVEWSERGEWREPISLRVGTIKRWWDGAYEVEAELVGAGQRDGWYAHEADFRDTKWRVTQVRRLEDACAP